MTTTFSKVRLEGKCLDFIKDIYKNLNYHHTYFVKGQKINNLGFAINE